MSATTVTNYLATWNAVDAAVRDDLLAQHWTASAGYTDPLCTASGREAISTTIAGVHGQFPGFVFTLVGEPDAHHSQTRFQWGLGPEGAEPLVVGFDVVVEDADGRIATVLGFLDKVPAAA
ncbi:nuclear transport factor 2 family protein [Gordonia sp. TBRC 11910]|uniref:Nuclear transport factor 2 family protein n=1 Tax=Gordonia asplenii TaxID=2725283 RepID=A0A848L1X7_9ACTN|nr:nuclear transport factor 2 family protein [Gordonia asplenii]NMO01658.1 nuclear transport factor 2 family protein [Gordonia asplenii]